MTLKTVKECATMLNISESRMREVLGRKNAPKPVIDPINIYKGRKPGKYDPEEIQNFYAETKGRQSIVDYWRTR